MSILYEQNMDNVWAFYAYNYMHACLIFKCMHAYV